MAEKIEDWYDTYDIMYEYFTEKKMKTYCYLEPVDETGVNEVCLTEKEILSEYWDWWYAKMIEKYGADHELITEQNCIDDWVVTHWASEKKL